MLKNLFKDDIVHTVAGFKYQYGSDNKFKKKQNLVVVHDAQKLSLEDLSQLKEMVDSSRGRLILLNNTKSTHGFSPGSPIKTLKELLYGKKSIIKLSIKFWFDIIDYICESKSERR